MTTTSVSPSTLSSAASTDAMQRTTASRCFIVTITAETTTVIRTVGAMRSSNTESERFVQAAPMEHSRSNAP
jgi:hypothetical protein